MINEFAEVRIAIFIGTLDIGGTQRQLGYLTDELASRGHQIVIVTLYPASGGQDWLKSKIEMRIHSLYPERPGSKLHTPFHTIYKLTKSAKLLRSFLKSEGMEILYSHLYMPNLIAWSAVRNEPWIRLVWGIRASAHTPSRGTNIPFRFCSWVSSSVPLIISNSYAGLAYHEKEGYKARRSVVIPNGIDTAWFKPDDAARKKLRGEWSVMDDEILIGRVGNLLPIKEYPIFLEAARALNSKIPKLKFACVGSGPHEYFDMLKSRAEKFEIGDKVIWAGVYSDMPAVYNALDLFCSSSSAEGFPNVIGEAMACGVPCVVTDAGDSARIVGDAGIVVPPGDPRALADGLAAAIQKLPGDKEKIRARIVENFSLKALVDTTEKELLALLQP